ncbi:hypothetical protein BC835DRAFT_896351 [Cytidiella melzeri]|nr:hypothetical protein BC835DRAFT_896351 [Cytidiella melzeri]
MPRAIYAAARVGHRYAGYGRGCGGDMRASRAIAIDQSADTLLRCHLRSNADAHRSDEISSPAAVGPGCTTRAHPTTTSAHGSHTSMPEKTYIDGGDDAGQELITAKSSDGNARDWECPCASHRPYVSSKGKLQNFFYLFIGTGFPIRSRSP